MGGGGVERHPQGIPVVPEEAAGGGVGCKTRLWRPVPPLPPWSPLGGSMPRAQLGVVVSAHASQLPLLPTQTQPTSPPYGPLCIHCAPYPTRLRIPRSVPFTRHEPFESLFCRHRQILNLVLPRHLALSFRSRPRTSAPSAPTAKTPAQQSHAGPHILPTGQGPSREFIAPALPGRLETTNRTD